MPMPPYRSGTGPPRSPSGAIFARISAGNRSARSRSRAPGAISLSAKSFASLRICSCSGVRSKSTVETLSACAWTRRSLSGRKPRITRSSRSALFDAVRDRRRRDGVLPTSLRDVERVVGLAEELLVVTRGRGVRRDAARDVHLDRLLRSGTEGPRRRDAYSIGRAHRGRELGLWHEHEELVAAEAGDDVSRAHLLANDLRELDEIAIALVVSEAVVHVLQRVAVDHHERQRVAVARRALDLLLHAAGEVARVVEAGQLVGDGEAVRLLERLRARECRRRLLREDLEVPHVLVTEEADARVRDDERAVEHTLAADGHAGHAAHHRQHLAERPARVLPDVGDDDGLSGRDDVRRDAVADVGRALAEDLRRDLVERGEREAAVGFETPEDPALRARHLHRRAQHDVEDLVDRRRAR